MNTAALKPVPELSSCAASTERHELPSLFVRIAWPGERSGVRLDGEKESWVVAYLRGWTTAAIECYEEGERKVRWPRKERRRAWLAMLL